MTDIKATDGKGVLRASQFPRTPNTLRLHHLMEEQHRLGIAGRITELREKSRWTQPDIADKLGITLRGYQKIEERGTTKFERVEEIAKIHEVDPEWIWEGEDRATTPDVLATLSPDSELREQLDRIEERQVELATALAEIATELARDKAPKPKRQRPGRAAGNSEPQ